MSTMPVQSLSKPGALTRAFLGVARFLVDVEAARGWGAPLEPERPETAEPRSTGDRVA